MQMKFISVVLEYINTLASRYGEIISSDKKIPFLFCYLSHTAVKHINITKYLVCSKISTTIFKANSSKVLQPLLTSRNLS